MSMSIQVNDFRWEPGKNDAEYIKLLESSRDEWQKIAQKAIAKLVKEQKPKPPITSEEQYGDHLQHCPSCGRALPNRGIYGISHYCYKCGQAVK